jgi:SAM-dependent methyltransferase
MALFDHPFTPSGSAEPPDGDVGRLLEMITGYWSTQLVRTAALYSIADHLAAGLTRAEDIAQVENLHPEATFRFLRACATIGLVNFDGTEFTSTSLLELLRSDRPDSLHAEAVWGGMPSHYVGWGKLPEVVRTGKSQIEAVYGVPLFDAFAADPVEASTFTNAMASMTRSLASTLAELIDVGTATMVVDVGGANGEFVHELMRLHPQLAGIVQDGPHVVPDAAAAAEKLGLSDRFSVVGGDFFESVPTADLHLLKLIVHDWDDKAAVSILRNCAQALNPGGRVIVADMVVSLDKGRPGLEELMDVNMMVMLTGRERSLQEFDGLFRKAGLELTKTTPNSSMLTLLEGRPL